MRGFISKIRKESAFRLLELEIIKSRQFSVDVILS
jgi:hypothetical protein